MLILLATGALTLGELNRVSQDVNHRIAPVSDLAHYGQADVWVADPPDHKGDCEDYVLTKRAELLAMGVPPDTMQIEIVASPNGAHAVLDVALVRHGKLKHYIADNLDVWALPRSKSFRFHNYTLIRTVEAPGQ